MGGTKHRGVCRYPGLRPVKDRHLVGQDRRSGGSQPVNTATVSGNRRGGRRRDQRVEPGGTWLLSPPRMTSGVSAEQVGDGCGGALRPGPEGPDVAGGGARVAMSDVAGDVPEIDPLGPVEGGDHRPPAPVGAEPGRV